VAKNKKSDSVVSMLNDIGLTDISDLDAKDGFWVCGGEIPIEDVLFWSHIPIGPDVVDVVDNGD